MMQTSDALRREKADVYLSTSLRAQRVAQCAPTRWLA